MKLPGLLRNGPMSRRSEELNNRKIFFSKPWRIPVPDGSVTLTAKQTLMSPLHEPIAANRARACSDQKPRSRNQFQIKGLKKQNHFLSRHVANNYLVTITQLCPEGKVNS